MRFLDLINKKKAGSELSPQEIHFFIDEYLHDRVPDYQVSALLMAICWQGMSNKETAELSLAMAHSGDMVDLSSIPGVKVDKHSTGGVGDKTSLILGPLVAACGVPVAKMSGRGLGHTGGTIDKLESLPGTSCDFSLEEFLAQVREIKLAIAGQTANLAPADKKLYALRDVSGTIESPALIAASILSKKIAAGAQKIVFDVKCGSGAFMEDLSSARELAQLMYQIGEQAGLSVHVIISNMDQVLGRYVGNRLEVYEAIQCLQGNAPEDLTELSLSLACEMLYLAGQGSRQDIYRSLEEKIKSGAALAKFREFLGAQGADLSYVDQPEKLLEGSASQDFLAPETGYISSMDTHKVGEASGLLGAGRSRLEDTIDPTAGLIFHKKLGDYVEAGEPICSLYSQHSELFTEAQARLASAFEFSDSEVARPQIILDRIPS